MFQTFCWNFLIETFSNNPFHSRGFQISKPAICHYQVIQAVTKLYPQTLGPGHVTSPFKRVTFSLTIPQVRVTAEDFCGTSPRRFFGVFSMATNWDFPFKKGPIFVDSDPLQVLHPSTAFPATAVVTWIQISPEVGCFSYVFFVRGYKYRTSGGGPGCLGLRNISFVCFF